MPDWDRGLELDDSASRPGNRMWRAASLAHIEPEKAVADVEEVVKDDKIRPPVIYQAARVCVLSSETVKDAARREQYAARAVAMLERASAQRYFMDESNVMSLKTDPDFDPLRGREDFRRLITELEANPK
jgi:hypothetical protein